METYNHYLLGTSALCSGGPIVVAYLFAAAKQTDHPRKD
jgi:hypothetical protein